MDDGTPAPDPHALARDWATLWHSEVAAIASDREMHETWQALAGFWAGAAGAMLAGAARARDDRVVPSAGTVAPARTAPAAAAPDARDAAVERLASRVAELERRLAGHD